jgi:hypothetical protein
VNGAFRFFWLIVLAGGFTLLPMNFFSGEYCFLNAIPALDFGRLSL